MLEPVAFWKLDLMVAISFLLPVVVGVVMALFPIGFSSPSIPAPVAAPPPPAAEPSAEEREAARLKEEGIQRRRRGRKSTIVTGGLGVEGPANVARKTLLGQ